MKIELHKITVRELTEGYVDNQELLNAVYASPWLSDAKRYFSKSNYGAYLMGNKYLTGSPIQQDYLEPVLDWISGGQIEQYMATHSIKDSDATALSLYFQQVINWVQAKFKYRSVIKGVDWGAIYTLVARRSHNAGQLPNALPRLQPPQKQQVVLIRHTQIYAFWDSYIYFPSDISLSLTYFST